MTGRVAVVTGAASGIGLGIARQLASDGHAVALLDLDGDAAGKAAADLSAQGCSVVGHRRGRCRSRRPRTRILRRARGAGAGHHRRHQRGYRGVRLGARRHAGEVGSSPGRESHGHVHLHPARRTRHAGGRLGTDRHHLIVQRPIRGTQHDALRGIEGRRHRTDEGTRSRVGLPRHHRQYHSADDRRHPDGSKGRGRRGRPERRHHGEDGSPRPGGYAARTSPPRAPSCAPRTRATSPAR